MASSQRGSSRSFDPRGTMDNEVLGKKRIFQYTLSYISNENISEAEDETLVFPPRWEKDVQNTKWPRVSLYLLKRSRTEGGSNAIKI